MIDSDTGEIIGRSFTNRNKVAYLTDGTDPNNREKEISIPDYVGNEYKVEVIKEFSCGKVDKLIIPSTVSEIRFGAFRNCASLREIEVESANENYSNYNNDGALYDKNIEKICHYPRRKKCHIFYYSKQCNKYWGVLF